MAKNKTTETNADVAGFINAFADTDQKRKDSFELLKLMQNTMATKNKTAETQVNVVDFINSFVEKEQKRNDSFRLIELMREWSGFEPKMWGPSIVGFGSYHYKYESGHEGEAPLVGFSPRKAAISLYVYSGLKEHEYLLKDLGNFKMGKACIYIKTLSNIDQQKLTLLIKETIKFLQSRYGIK